MHPLKLIYTIEERLRGKAKVRHKRVHKYTEYEEEGFEETVKRISHVCEHIKLVQIPTSELGLTVRVQRYRAHELTQ